MNAAILFAILLTHLNCLVLTSKPNIVLILTDDQDVVLNGMTPLKKTRQLLGEEGSIFSNAFATTPICCPSRSSLLTGLYLHSHGTVNNSLNGGCSSANWQHRHEPNTFGASLHRTGYKTFYAGKYLNKYGLRRGSAQHVPEGWDWWVGLLGNSVYYNYTLSVNGSRVEKGDDESDYLTDVLKDYSLMFLKETAVQKEAFLMVISPPAPHEPFTPAKRHLGKFSGFTAPRTPNFNRPVKNSKHWLLRLSPEVLPQETVKKIDEVFRNRWETLLAVDELVESIVKRLSELKVLNNTYIIFTSDHGFHLGQFGQPWDKRQPYETDIRIPMMMRGPKAPKTEIKNAVLNIDIAPTILDLAGLQADAQKMDGKSFLHIFNSKSNPPSPRSFLIEYQGEHDRTSNSCYDDSNLKLCCPKTSCKCFDAKNNTFVCLRRLSEKADDIFCQFDDSESFREYYDIRKDPYQVNNLHNSSRAKIREQVLNCSRMKIALKEPVDKCFDQPHLRHEPETVQL